ncbi:hypothetical protein [Actinocrispum sp. NPDC049592]|uniref:hypothetical protein n=1 Tax=Actinocrispum sp. NPDC049592 TaxID=3154835 RepID=UPI003418A513
MRWTLAVAVVVLAGCSGGGETVISSLPSTSAPPARMTTAEYQAQIGVMEKTVAPAVAAVQNAGSLPDLDNARLAVQQVLQSEGNRLSTLNPPAPAEPLNNSMFHALTSAALRLKSVDVNATPPADACNNPVDQLAYARENVNVDIRTLAGPMKVLNDAGYPVSAFIPDEPATPEQNRRGANGKVLLRSGPKGRGRLKITNSDTSDVAISVVTGGNPAKPQVMVYVQAGQGATVTGISGTYQVYFKSGTDWDEGRRGFTRDCHYEKFDQSFDQKSDWEISLIQSAGGNASTSTVPGY